jgi:hypothetical protein
VVTVDHFFPQKEALHLSQERPFSKIQVAKFHPKNKITAKDYSTLDTSKVVSSRWITLCAQIPLIFAPRWAS